MDFISYPLTQIFRNKLIESKGWDETCPVSINRLSLVEVNYIDFENNLKKGRLITLDAVADSVANIFKELFESEMPIQSVNLLDHYNYNDILSMEANNSSCFNNRVIAGSVVKSLHAYGAALDINPVQNPYIVFKNKAEGFTKANIYPSSGKDYINRSIMKKGMIEPFVEIFYRNGFNSWGGNWQTPIDYHHFQIDRTLAEKLCSSESKIAYRIWQEHINSLN